MKRWIGLGVVVVVAVAIGGCFALKPPPPPAAMLDAAPPMDQATVERGAYLARVGDCVACHTAEGGKPMAGGLAFATPLGVVYSTNITPDPKTGIGHYTLAEFEGALRRGVSADGEYLYPAMPYTSFAKITDDDVKALYAYFMKGVAPVEREDNPSAMRFPFNIRLGLGVWNKLFLDSSRFVADPSKDAQWNRGAYIAEGLGHCGTCHTPRGLAMQEKATVEDGKHYLAGGEVDNWRAVSLRRPSTEAAIAQLLKTGLGPHGAAFGPMTEVVENSTQYFTDADRAALARFLVSLSPGKPAPAAAGGAPETLYSTRGGLGYYQFCSACHGRDGEGVAGIFPPLAQNAAISGAGDEMSLIHVVLTGWKSAKTEARPHGFFMPRFSELADSELAEILSFVRANFGNAGAAVPAADVKTLREALALKPAAPTPYKIPRLADLIGAPNSSELITGLRLMSETKALLPHNVGNQLTCSSCHMNGGTIAHGSPYVGITSLFPMYNPRAGRVITIEERLNGCFRRSMSGTPLSDDSPQMRAMVAYMDWMKDAPKSDGKIVGRGTAKISKDLKPDGERGKTLYQKDCAMCHGENGEGKQTAGGEWPIPPLWGDNSYNIGAGMARTYTAAGFIKANMPIAASTRFPQGQGGLSDQDALDIAEYFTHQPRPDFPDKVNDWPKGGKPKDARY
jgi:thiosulfate dehydrogenase